MHRRGEDEREAGPTMVKIPRFTNGGLMISPLSFAMSPKRVSAAHTPIGQCCDALAAAWESVCLAM